MRRPTTPKAPSQRAWIVSGIVLAISVMASYFVPGALRFGEACLLLAGLVFIVGVLLAFGELRQRGRRLTVFPHGVLVVAWILPTATLAVLFFGPELNSQVTTILRVAVVILIGIAGGLYFTSGWGKFGPRSGG